MKASEFRELGTQEIEQRVRDLDDQVFRARLQKSMGSVDAANKMRSLRRDRARGLTVLRERQSREMPVGGREVSPEGASTD